MLARVEGVAVTVPATCLWARLELGSPGFLSACKHSSVARQVPITAVWFVFHSLWGTFKTSLI